MAHSIMADVLLSLDLHTQAKTKWICTLWHQLLSDRRSSGHLIIDSSILQPKNLIYFMLSCHNLYKFSWALDMALTTDTKSLTLLDDLQFTNLTVVKKTLVTLLTIRDIQLDYIVIKNGFSFDGVTINPDMYFLPEPVGQHMDRLWKCSILTTLSTVCRHLVLRNFTVRDFTHYMKSRFMYSEFPRDRVPLHCRREMPLTIPYLILHSSDGDGGIFRKFLLAAEMNHPPIGATVYDSVRSIHRRWVDNLAYPNEWRAIRHLLQLYCGFLLDGSDRGWVDVDLRQVDVSTLTKYQSRLRFWLDDNNNQ
ncbi:uncharacterized protein LOC129599830 [Paramacrobiotus metropolitanus]|uniref:uncharacterized protein LOC129599830 n=1 Tax=Paramacrobiotus metropolitanus TaxID=2943436 RepID=UPI00244618EB|nr:uncharacterized protein LOC129599830 [Paramacrobiotus metropolitanus]